LAHNLGVVRRRVGQAGICATIKANAYGHGVDLVAGLLRDAGLEWGCVYSLHEALDLARFGPLKFLVLSPLVLREPSPKLVQRVLEWGGAEVRFTITDAHTARCLSESVVAGDKARHWPVHVQVDAGLTRMGAAPGAVPELVRLINGLPGLALEGLFAHFSHGDVPGHATVEQQLAVFHKVADPVKKAQPRVLLHMQNSGGALHLGDAGMDMVRIGIALYGLQPSTQEPIAGLRPIARVTAPVLAIHERPAGTGVGYGHTFVTTRASRLAVVPIGYADGYPRLLSNRGVAQVRGRDVPVVGRVSMDQIVVDLTDVKGAAAGEEVTVISWDSEKANCLDRMADTVGTIGYELATHLGGRLKRMIVE
jgi:alanine racemase